MKIMVAVKHVVDYNIVPRVKQDGSDVEISGVKMGINPFDEIAVEEALRLKEKGIATEIVAVSIGAENSKDTLRHALAMGVDRAVLVQAEGKLQPLGVAKLLKAVAGREQPDLILLGKQAIDDDAGQAGQMLAALLGVGQGLFASEIKVNGNEIEVNREVEGGTETVALQLPAIVTADLRLNEPRFIKLPNMMMAKKKPIDVIAGTELGVDFASHLSLLNVAEPAPRKPGVIVNSVAELVEKLRIEKVLA
jgi:electron transfer flavoprotein beta subunit